MGAPRDSLERRHIKPCNGDSRICLLAPKVKKGGMKQSVLNQENTGKCNPEEEGASRSANYRNGNLTIRPVRLVRLLLQVMRDGKLGR